LGLEHSFEKYAVRQILSTKTKKKDVISHIQREKIRKYQIKKKNYVCHLMREKYCVAIHERNYNVPNRKEK
jgi:hypothetical protein